MRNNRINYRDHLLRFCIRIYACFVIDFAAFATFKRATLNSSSSVRAYFLYKRNVNIGRLLTIVEIKYSRRILRRVRIIGTFDSCAVIEWWKGERATSGYGTPFIIEYS